MDAGAEFANVLVPILSLVGASCVIANTPSKKSKEKLTSKQQILSIAGLFVKFWISFFMIGMVLFLITVISFGR